MKKFVLLLATIFTLSANAFAQTQTAYCDVYARGSGRKMKITIMYKAKQSTKLAKKTNLGDVLNLLAKDGWVLDKEIVIPRHLLWSCPTRHKLHLILKKEYNIKDDPFMMLSRTTMAIGDKFTYNNIDVRVCEIIDDIRVVITPNNTSFGNRETAMIYCSSLGKEWYIPSYQQILNMSTKWLPSDPHNSEYWIMNTDNKSTNKTEFVIYDNQDPLFTTPAEDSYKALICPIAIVNKSELK